MRNIFSFLILAFCAAASTASAANTDVNEKYAIYYSDKAPIEKFKPYQFLVFDGKHHPALQPLKEDGKMVIGYISLGEVDSNSPHFAALKNKGLILMENKNWPGSYYVDMRNPMWPKIVVEQLVPEVLRQGFDGIFLDTLDNPIELENQNSGQYRGMTEAAEHLVKAIRTNFPTIKIMMNRAYPLLPHVGDDIDMELGESVYTDYNFDRKTYGHVQADDYHEQVNLLQAAQRQHPKLKVYTLDYAKPTDTSSIIDIYKTERANGFIPYVATVALDQLVEEPKAK